MLPGRPRHLQSWGTRAPVGRTVDPGGPHGASSGKPSRRWSQGLRPPTAQGTTMQATGPSALGKRCCRSQPGGISRSGRRAHWQPCWGSLSCSRPGSSWRYRRWELGLREARGHLSNGLWDLRGEAGACGPEGPEPDHVRSTGGAGTGKGLPTCTLPDPAGDEVADVGSQSVSQCCLDRKGPGRGRGRAQGPAFQVESRTGGEYQGGGVLHVGGRAESRLWALGQDSSRGGTGGRP